MFQKYLLDNNSKSSRKNQRTSRSQSRETLKRCSHKDRTNRFLSYGERYPRKRSTIQAVRDCLFNYNSSTGVYTKDGKKLNKPASKSRVEARIAMKIPSTFSNEDFVEHFNKQKILYAYNSPWKSTKFILLMLDLDVFFKIPDRFKEIIERELNCKIYWEVSPSGNLHGYLFVDVEGLGSYRINDALVVLDQFLKSLVHKYQWHDEIKELTIKGRPHEIRWRNNRAEVEKQYALFQLPVEIPSRKQEFFDTSIVPLNYFFSFEDQIEQNNNLRPVSTKPQRGSCSFKLFDLDGLAVARHLTEALPIVVVKGKNRSKVIHEDYAIALAIIKYIQELDNDGAMPSRLIRKIWNKHYQEGSVSRPFNKNRFACIRKVLGQSGFLCYEDPNYFVGFCDAQGNYIKGQCAKWGLVEGVLDVLGGLAPISTFKQQQHIWYNKIISSTELPQDLIKNYASPLSDLWDLEQKLEKIVVPWELAA